MNEIKTFNNAEKPPLVIPDVSNCPFSIVFNEDCVQGLKRFADNYFDLAIVDPPYGIGAENHAGNADNGWKQWDKKSWDNAIPDKEYFDQLFRVSKNQIIWGGNYFANLLPNSQGWIFWDKGQRDFSLADGELCWTSFKKSLRVFEMARAKAKASIGYDKIHPTQKPVQLYDFCYNFAKLEKGDLVLDTHLGSGSSRISANKGGFNFIGFETDKEYYEAQEKRFKNFTAQQRLF
ncbi:MAG: site-specific DNA-methyltransferase [Epsilonproteobacteria bacterium]|nr:site-specific DNA-methyltransferase [Campylobacterota bacterium]